MTKKEMTKLIKRANVLRGKRQRRFLTESEISKMAELDRKTSLKGKTIRIYSNDGFVANSYKYRADIDYIERYYDNDGNKHFVIGQSSAKRRYGNGALTTVNNRAY